MRSFTDVAFSASARERDGPKQALRVLIGTNSGRGHGSGPFN